MAKVSRKKPKFEDAVTELETIIDQIESGETGLEQSLEAYEKGMKLIGQCRGILETVEKRIGELSVDKDGGLKSKRGSTGAEEDGDDNGDEELDF